MAALYEIDQRILALVDEETGEITDFEQLDKLQLERDAKIENIALWIKNLKSDEESYKAEKQVFEKKRKAAEQKRESLRYFLSQYLNGQKFKSTKVECGFRNLSRVEIDNIYDLPDEFLKYKKPEIDETATKNAVKKAIEEGKEIAGARLVNTLNLQIK